MKRALRWGIGAGILAIIVFLSSCGKGPVALVDGKKISSRDFYRTCEMMTIPGTDESVGSMALSYMVTEYVVQAEAEKEGITVTEEEIEKELKKMSPNLEELEKKLKERGRALEDLKRQVRLGILAYKLQAKDVEVTEEALKEHFEQNRAILYDEPEKIGLQVIMVRERAEANEVRRQLSKGADFEQLARAKSLHPSNIQGGDLGMRARNRISPPELAEAVWDLPIGEISQSIKIGDYFYVARVSDRREAKQAKFEEIKDKVREDYIRLKSDPTKIRRLVWEAKVTILWDKYTPLEKMFRQTAPAKPPIPQPSKPSGKSEE